MDTFKDDIADLLEEWNLSHLYVKFKEQKISSQVLKILTQNHIDKLFNDLPVGDQALFENNLNKWMKCDDNGFDFVPSYNFNSSKKIYVKDILNTTHNGKEIENFYRKSGKLFDEQRNLLIATITRYVEGNGIDCSLSDCIEFEKEICSIFPTEEIDFYRTGKRGKIYNKLANLKRIAKGAFKYNIPTHNEAEIEFEENYDTIVACLRDKGTTAEDFEIYWRQCAPLRFKELKEADTSTIFKLWPEFLKPSAWKLIDTDFKLKYPTAKSLFEQWSQYGEKILNLMKQKVSLAFVSKKLLEIDIQNEDLKNFEILWYLHFLFPPSQKMNTEPSGSKIRKKFSIVDSQNGFAVLAQTNEELETKIKLLQLQNINIQPKL